MTKRIAIVGGGAAGAFTAYELRRAFPRCELHLFEREPRIGGNVRTLWVEHEGEEVSIDSGAQFFHPYPQPGYVALCRELGLYSQIVRAPVGLTVWDRQARAPRLYIPSAISQLARYRLADWQSLVHFSRYLAYGLYLEQSGGSWSLRLDEWLRGLRLVPRSFRERVVLPFNYQFLSLPLSRMGEGSARYALSYFLRKVTGPLVDPHWRGRSNRGGGPEAPSLPFFETLQNLAGVDSVLREALKRAGANIYLDEPAVEVRGGSIRTTRRTLDVDHIVMTCEPPAASALVRSANPALADALAELEVVPLPIAITKGSSHMPSSRRHWQPVNTVVDGDKVSFTVYFAPLRQPQAHQTLALFKTWGSPDIPAPLPGELLRLKHQVLLPTGDFMAQREALLRRFQGQHQIWIAGGWTTAFDSQESALRSARAVVHGLAGSKAKPVPSLTPDALRRGLRQLSKLAPASIRAQLAKAVDDVEHA